MTFNAQNQPEVSVGLLSDTSLRFCLNGIYECAGADVATGIQTVRISDSGLGIEWNGRVWPELLFTPTSPDGDHFEIDNVTIGIDFHWQRTERQRFRGSLAIIVDNGRLTAVNVVPVETYLVSVISSEMSATSSLPLLRAHAVISRSWLMAMIERRKGEHTRSESTVTRRHTPGEIIRWWDRSDHIRFDVCADDHCQRYQGIGRETGTATAGAVADTRGEVLVFDGRICDARFSKCCGGVFERFESCWEDEPHPYLTPRRDYTEPDKYPDLTAEDTATQWIESSPEAFCNTSDPQLIRQVLNDFDREHLDFFRWEQTYTTRELSEIVNSRLDTDLGTITDLIPIERGPSGRIVRLRIVGTKQSIVIGKELMIRRTLSTSHLRSSAFTVTRTPDGFRLRGAGWGHGVGLCQIGASVMAERGYDYRSILNHYYPGTSVERLY